MNRSKPTFPSRDIRGQLILLGTGTSVGVPMVGCGCAVCMSDDPRNRRTRCSAIFGLPDGNLLVDTSPDLRQQLLRENIGIVHAVAYTHEHADHVMGFDDLRPMQFYLGGAVPIYCNEKVRDRLHRAYDYVFADAIQTHAGALPAVELHPIGDDPFEVLGAKVIPIPMQHGPNFSVLGFRVGNVAYCTDTNFIPDASMRRLEGVEFLVLDGLRADPHPTHFNIEEAIKVAKLIGAKKTFLTHTNCAVDYKTANASLPNGIEIAWDGLTIPFSIAD